MQYQRFDIPDPLKLEGLRHIDIGETRHGQFVFAIDHHQNSRRETLNDSQRYPTRDEALAAAIQFLERRKQHMDNNGNALAPATTEFELVEQVDDRSIVEMMTGNAVKEYVYSFKQGGKMIEGLTLEGINEAANRKGGIEVTDMKYEERENSWLATCRATDTNTGSSRFGAYEQSKKQGSKDDPHAFTKAVHKAQRNAIKQLLPVPLIKQVINFYLHGELPPELPPGEPEEPKPDKPCKAQREAFAIATKLQPQLDKKQIGSVTFWNWVRKHYNVMSRKDMTEEQWVTLAAELRGAESSPDLFNELVSRIKTCGRSSVTGDQ